MSGDESVVRVPVLPDPIRPDRVAGDAIRGYLRQTIGIALEWLDLPDGAVLVCEGDEDYDRYLIDDQGRVVDLRLGQMKDLAGSVSARNGSVVEVIGNFLVEFEHHTRAGRPTRFVFTTTAARAKQRLVSKGALTLSVDVLSNWASLPPAATAEHADAVKVLCTDVKRIINAEAARLDRLDGAAPKHAAALREALTFLDADGARWATFLGAVRWEFGAPSLTEANDELVRRLSADPRTAALPCTLLAQRLTVAVLHASIPPDAHARQLTRSMLDELASTTRESLEEWSATHHASGLDAWLTRLEALEIDVDALKTEIAQSRPFERVRRMSERVCEHLARRAELRTRAASAHLERSVTDTIATWARAGSLLVVGVPGVGKSAALHDVYVALVAAGVDTVILEASQLVSEESLVLEALEEWPGEQTGVLLLDALDAVRDGTEADALERVVSSLVGKHGRWNVVASVRRFDLDHHRGFRAAFASSETSPKSRHHPSVACIEIDVLTDRDLDILASRLPELGSFLDDAPRDLATLLRVPFHLELVCTLIDQGVRAEDLAHVTTRAQLLDEYWRCRIEHPRVQAAREALLYEVCKRMVERRRMFASVHPPLPQSQELDPVRSIGLLVEPALDEGIRDDRRVEFSHHVMFDYTLARVWLPPETDDLGTLLAEQPELVLFARPSLDLYFERLWHRDPQRTRFWETVLGLCANPRIPEVAAAIGPGVCAHHPITAADVAPLLAAVRTGTTEGQRALRHVELALRGAPIAEPLRGAWDLLALETARLPSLEAQDLARLMVSTLIGRGRGSDPAVGETARLLFDAWKDEPKVRRLWLDSIGSLCATASTDVTATSARIRTLIEPAALQREGHETLYRIAGQIEALLFAPALVRDVYVAAFAQSKAYVRADDQVALGDSTIFSMSTSRRDAYGTSLTRLAQSYRAFVQSSFMDATAVLMSVVDGEAASQAQGEIHRGQLRAGGALTAVIDDFGVSPGPDSEVSKLVRVWLEEAQTPALASGVASTVVALLAQRGVTSARLWRVLSELGRISPSLLSPLTDIFESPDMYRLLGLRHTATAWLKTFFAQLTHDQRAVIEQAIVIANGGAAVPDATAGIDETLATIADHVVTAEAHALITRLRARGPLPENRPPVRFGRVFSRRLSATDHLRQLGVNIDTGPNHELLAASRALSDASDRLAAAIELRARIEASFAEADVVIQNTAWQAIVTAIAELADAKPSAEIARGILELAGACMAARDVAVRAQAVDVLGALGGQAACHAVVLQQLTALTQDESPALRQRALSGIARVAPQPIWETLEARAPIENDSDTLLVLVCELLQRAIPFDPIRALPHALQLIARTSGGDGGELKVAEALHFLIAARYISHGDAAYAEEAVAGLGRDLGAPRDHTLRAPRDWLRVPRSPADPILAAARARAIQLVMTAATSAIDVLRAEPTPQQHDRQRAVARMELCAAEIYFASGGASGEPSAPRADLLALLNETEPVLRLLSSSGVPPVVHYVIQTLERLFPADPPRCYALIADAVTAGSRYGYETEGLAVDLVLRITTHLLAEHRALVQTDERLQAAIIRVLDSFVRIGWTKAHAVTFELASVWR